MCFFVFCVVPLTTRLGVLSSETKLSRGNLDVWATWLDVWLPSLLPFWDLVGMVGRRGWQVDCHAHDSIEWGFHRYDSSLSAAGTFPETIS